MAVAQIKVPVIPRDQLMEHGPHEFSADASGCGFPPGHWPRVIEIQSGWGFGNGQAFYLQRVDETGGYYLQGSGCITLQIFND